MFLTKGVAQDAELCHLVEPTLPLRQLLKHVDDLEGIEFSLPDQPAGRLVRDDEYHKGITFQEDGPSKQNQGRAEIDCGVFTTMIFQQGEDSHGSYSDEYGCATRKGTPGRGCHVCFGVENIEHEPELNLDDLKNGHAVLAI
ncbi:hypothetical protein MLD38_037524 [Melastoma candidum]|uniref:Uncharacterized protein n=1 Tax=Melastoma candidum TaxID=119954 RepID=A0ACB9LPP9_9MYRT|nr:hypothetical protein MLD38_037524 [Melastoma candidum]